MPSSSRWISITPTEVSNVSTLLWNRKIHFGDVNKEALTIASLRVWQDSSKDSSHFSALKTFLMRFLCGAESLMRSLINVLKNWSIPWGLQLLLKLLAYAINSKFRVVQDLLEINIVSTIKPRKLISGVMSSRLSIDTNIILSFRRDRIISRCFRGDSSSY